MTPEPRSIYATPTVAALALLGLLAVWAWSEVSDLQTSQLERARRFSDHLTLFVDVLIHQSPPGLADPDATLLEFQREAPGVSGLRLLRGGHTLAVAGEPIPEDVPADLLNDTRRGERLYLTRALRCTPQEPPPIPARPWFPAPGSPLSTPPASACADPPRLTFALDVHVDWARGRALSFLNKLALALLAIAALTIAWALGIRQRRSSAALAVERTRRAHLEELSFAAAGLAHETKNPLGLIRGFAQRIEGTPDLPDDTHRLAVQIVDAADRATERLGEFLHFARLRDPDLQPTPARPLILALAEVLRYDCEDAEVTLDLQLPDLHLLADPDMLRQVLLNLLLNSLEASPPRTTITLRLTHEARRARIEVIDQGRGIDPHLLPDVFKPYVTDSPRGHGLGLAIVRRITERHGWTLDLQSTPHLGTTVTLGDIPLTSEPPP